MFDQDLLNWQNSSLGNGIKDNVQVYNIPKFDGYHQRQQPAVLSDNIAEIEAFSRVIHELAPIRDMVYIES